MKKISPYVLTIFLVILLFVPIFGLIKGDSAPEDSVIEARAMVALQPKATPNLQRALDHFRNGEIFQGVELLIDLFTATSFLEKVERAASDQFPFRMPIIQFSKAVERGIIEAAYAFLPDRVLPADMSNNNYIDKDRNQLVFEPYLFNENLRQAIDQRIENLSTLMATYPEINFYIYYHQTLHGSEFHPLNQYYAEADRGQSINYFEENLPEGLVLEKFLLAGMDDHNRYYFRTDHHWNVNGALYAYEDIYQMLAQNYPAISPILKPEKIVEFPEIEFLGNMARLTFYPIQGDDFAGEVVDFPPQKIVYGGQVLEEKPRQVYFEGDYSNIPYINHYNEFYGRVTDLITYSTDNGANRNLLIIGSSFRNALDPLLASHYDHTYCVDLRYYTTFSLSEFLQEHEVDDIILLGTNQVLFQDLDYWTIKP